MKDHSTVPAGFEDLCGRTFHERYAITELLASSAHRVAFAGIEQDSGQAIVLVLVRPVMLNDAAVRARFERRVRACARVRHPAVAGPIDSGEALDGNLWLVFERPDGVSLDRHLASLPAGRLEWAAARPLLLELVRGLGAAHARGVVHGSVSPACCWVHGVGSDAPALRLLDWGANTDPAGDEPEPSCSRTTTLGRDPLFMAPETAGGIFGDERSDAYLVGLLAWFMLVGRPPFQAANAFQLVSMHLQVPVPEMREAGAEVPAAVEAWVRSLLAKEPAQRPASMADVEQGILALDELGQPRVASRTVGGEEQGRRRGRRGRTRASAAAREQAVQQLGESAREPAHGLGRRLPGQEIVDPRAAIVPSAAHVSLPPSRPLESEVQLAPSPAPVVPPTAAAVASVDAFERTVALGSMQRIAAAQPIAPVAAPSPRESVLYLPPAPRATGRRASAAVQPPVQSWLTMWMVIVTLFAAAVGVAIGLLLGGR